MNIYINNSESDSKSDSDSDLEYDSDNTDTQSVDTNEDIDKYMYKKNMNISLKKLFGPLDNNEINKLNLDLDWKPPLFHGLKNSEPILPNYYYINKNNPLKKIEYIKFIKETINDLKILNKYQLEYIKNLPAPEMFEIINTFNASNKTLFEIIEWGK